MIGSYLSLHLNPLPDPWFPFSSHPWSVPCCPPLPFAHSAGLILLSCFTCPQWLMSSPLGSAASIWYPCCHVTTFPYCEEACQSPVSPIANWELSPAGNSLQTQLADWEIFLTAARKLRLSILGIMKTLNQIRSSIWWLIKANPFPKKKKGKKMLSYFLIGLITLN